MMKGPGVIVDISIKNIKRWKWRMCSIAVLVALAFVLYVLYAGFIETSRSGSERELSSLELPYDLMILCEPGERLLGEPEWPEPPRAFDAKGKRLEVVMVEYYERTTQVTVDSAGGTFNLLGLPIDSRIYHPDELHLQGRWLQNAGEIVLPLETALRAGVSLGDSFRLSSWSEHPWQNGLRHRSFKVVGIYDAYDLRPALVVLEDANALALTGEPNSCLLRYRRNQKASDGIDTTLKSFLDWIRPAYPQATFIYRETPQLLGEKLLVRIYQPGESLLGLILLLVCIGVLTIAVMTYLERRKEFAALKTVGISNRQMILLFVLEYAVAEILGLVAAGALLLMLSAQLDWFGALDGGTLFKLLAIAGASTVAAVVIGVFYPVTTATKATINQLLYARRIPFFARQINHMENPSSFLVYRERVENLRLLKLPSLTEAQGLLVLKQCGDTVKKGEMVATEERLFGFAFREWIAFCDGTITVLDSNGVVGIRPDDEQAPFYLYSVHLLEAEQNRLRARHRGIAAAATGAVASKAEASIETPQADVEASDSEIVDYALIARAEQQRSVAQTVRRQTPGKERTLWKKIRPLLGLLICGISYYALYQWAAYQGSVVDAAAYYSEVVILTDLQDALTARGNLQPYSAVEIRNRIAGRIEEVLVRDGEVVDENQVLFRLENLPARVALDQARMELAQAQLAFDALRMRSEVGAADLQEQYLQALSQQNTSVDLAAERKGLRITADSNGVIAAIHAREGEVLKENSPVFDFYSYEREDTLEREIKLLQAKTKLDAATRALEQLEIRAACAGVVTGPNVAEGQWVESGESVLAIMVAHHELDEHDSIALRRAEIELDARKRDLEHLEFGAPGGGWLSQFGLRIGDSVSSGATLGFISDDSGAKVRINVPQSQIAGIIHGAEVVVRDFEGRVYRGEVNDIAASGVTDPRTQAVTFAVEIQVHDENLRPGVRVEAVLTSYYAVQAHIGPFVSTTEPLKITELSAPVAGEVVAVHVENGVHLLPEQIMVVLRNEELVLAYAAAEAHVNMLRRVEHPAPVDATVVRLLVNKGDSVQEGQILALLRNEKLQAEYLQTKQVYEELVTYRQGNETLRSVVAGTLRSVYVRPGDVVVSGQLLAEMSNPDLEYQAEQASAAFLKLDAAYQAAGLNPESGALAVARLALEKAQVALKQRERDVESLTMRASQAGTVHLARIPRLGEDASALQLLVTLHSEDLLNLTVNVDETEIELLSHGMNVDVSVDAFPNEIFRGIVEDITPVGLILENQVVYPVTVSVRNDPRLRTGMTASLRIVLGEVQNILAVPVEYVYWGNPNGYSEAIEVVDLLLNGRLITTAVQTGFRNKEMVEIVSGVREGDIIFRVRESSQ